MSQFTPKEIAMLKVFYEESVNTCGGCTEDQNMSFSNAQDLVTELGWNAQEVGGVMSSLEKKGAITDLGESTRDLRIMDFSINIWAVDACGWDQEPE